MFLKVMKKPYYGLLLIGTFYSCLCNPGKGDTSDFCAYYTKIEADNNFENYEITGKYADVVVNLGNDLQFVFCRSTSYLPYLESSSGKNYARELIPRSGDGPPEKPDKYNKYSYIRIIENTPTRIVVHWRYMPDFQELNFDGVVHEIYTFTPDKKVIREIIEGRQKLAAFNDPGNKAVQEMQLGEDGIEEISFKPAIPLENPTYKPINGSPVINEVVGNPIAWWKFDEGMQTSRDITMESISGVECEIGGNGALWKKGISGTTLAFDGYYTRVTPPSTFTPQISDGFTIEGWVVLGVYPYDWVAIAHQCEWEEQGWFFGVDEYGHLAVMLSIVSEWQVLRSSEQLPLNEWVHVAASFDKSIGRVSLYQNGKKTDSEKISQDKISLASTSLQIGLNSMKLPASGFPTIVGIEGLLDELKIYDQPVSDDEMLNSYESLKPPVALRKNPDLQKRHLPVAEDLEGFGGYYTKLEYHDLWDNMWRTTIWPDVVVKFDDFPTSVVFWRGPNYGPAFVTENNKWMIDQSVETGYEGYGCCEHMSDKQCRFAHVRIIENTPARIVVHWRYAFISTRNYLFPDNFPPTNEIWESYKSWIDEYYTIYPDGVVIRKLNNHCGASVYWQDIQFLIPAGETPEDQMNIQALTLGDIQLWGGTNFNKLELCWENGRPENTLEGANIELVNLKSKYKVFLIFPEGIYIRPWVAGRPGFYSKFVSWNHWPAAQIPSDGRGSRFPDRLSHSALAAADNAVFHGNVAMYGFTKEPIESLQTLTLSWNYPPPIKRVSGASHDGYDVGQRAYLFEIEDDEISFDFIGSEVRPVFNPCFIIKKWHSNHPAKIKVESSEISGGGDYKQGIIRDTDGTQTLIIWLELASEEPLKIRILK